MKKFIIIISLCLFYGTGLATELVLSENSLGPLKLSKQTRVSLQKLRKLFPQYKITHEIAQGDSPDFHYFGISDKNDEAMFYIASYLDDKTGRNQTEVDVDLLVIESADIKDKFGITTGMYFEDIHKRRKENLNYDANHHDYHYGSGKIWYMLSSEDVYNKFGHTSPAETTLDDIKKTNPLITEISWPTPRW